MANAVFVQIPPGVEGRKYTASQWQAVKTRKLALVDQLLHLLRIQVLPEYVIILASAPACRQFYLLAASRDYLVTEKLAPAPARHPNPAATG